MAGSASLSWVQIGDDIDGEAAGDYFGASVSLSSDGTRLAVGAYRNFGSGVQSGHVRVFDWDSGSSSWVQRGADIEGEAAGDFFGASVSLSSDGTRVAVGAPQNDGNGIDSGHVRVFEWDSGSSAWVQRGADIDGEAAGDGSGTWGSVSLASDGSRVAIGARSNGSPFTLGHVRVFDWDSGSSSWVQLGLDIDGEARGDQFGASVSLSSDGSRVAGGAPYNDGNGIDSGHVRVFEWDSGSSSWVQLGADIDGEAAGDSSGFSGSVSLSSDGSRVAIGAVLNDGNGIDTGHIRVFDWDSGSSSWVQVGVDIDGEAANAGFGFGGRLSLSLDGSRIAARGRGASETRVGEALIFEFDSVSWEQIGDRIDGEQNEDGFPSSLSLSSDGSRLAIGASQNIGSSECCQAGHVRVFELTSTTTTEAPPAPAGPRVPGQVPPWPEAIPNVDGTVSVLWAEPFQDGAGPITGYRAVARPQPALAAQASDNPVSLASGGSCSTIGFVCVIAGLDENVDYLFEVFASNSEGEGAGRMTQRAIRIVPQTPATTFPDTVAATLPLVAEPQPLPVTGNNDDLVTWAVLLAAFGALIASSLSRKHASASIMSQDPSIVRETVASSAATTSPSDS